MKVTGQCHCGKISYEAVLDTEKVSICHCTDCQMLTGSAYRVSVPVPKEDFRLFRGEPKVYIKTADSGNKRAHTFCPDCGTPIHSSSVLNPTAYSLRVGCLDEREQLPPKRQNWCKSAVSWSMNLEQIPQNQGQ
ncbi:aldehyde-activating protein [Leptospira perolatii]|uniref:Aldehyde-activating protein n=1 Tax=Leptospira perolatii TaxID=2023191 RepID=A0A2M9ZKJ4_9LEPT|nr:aldehyde-activating protein [Leptospira perolatii]PJZ72569.1 aldehyde-activating protein [Leptospira perolatii]